MSIIVGTELLTEPVVIELLPYTRLAHWSPTGDYLTAHHCWAVLVFQSAAFETQVGWPCPSPATLKFVQGSFAV